MVQRLLLLMLVLALMACGYTADTQDGEEADEDVRRVTVALAYIPNVQFAPFYVADSKGYFADAGLDVQFDYNFETDVTQRVAAWPDSEVEFAMSGGLSVMLARQQGLPVVTVMTQYQQFPVVFFSKSMHELEEPEDLQNKSIGIPGRFGASYYGLQALLYASEMQENDLDIQEVGFNQFQLVLEDNIDVASGYAMNEPVKLHEEGWQVDMLRVADYFPLVSDGIVSSEALIEREPDLVRSFVQAVLRGLQETLDNPDEAFELSLEYIPEADLGNPDFERTVLQESLPYWDAERLGYSTPRKWERSYALLRDLELVSDTMAPEEAYTNRFVE